MSKEQARLHFRQRRSLVKAPAREAAGELLARHALSRLGNISAPAPTVAAYLSVGTEPPTLPLLTALHDAGFRVAVPVCEPEFRLSWTRWYPGVPLQPGLFPSLAEPAGPRFSLEQPGSVHTFLVPALAADAAGARMGKGGGYYDRFLARARAAGNAAPAVAVVYSEEFVAAGTFESSPLDMGMDGVLTPSGWQELPAHPVYT